jgi:hypothetical protein
MLTFDLSAFERKARELEATIDQVPFALSQALNQAVSNAKEVLVRDTWPRHVEQRNPSFIRASLKIEYSNKRNLRAAIVEDPRVGGRGNLLLHAKGGTRRAKGSNIAVPTQNVKARRGSHGVPKGLRPANIPNSFRKGDVLFQRTGRKGRKLKLMYALKPSARIPAQVPFEEDFRTAVLNDLRVNFPLALKRAMATRRPTR